MYFKPGLQKFKLHLFFWQLLLKISDRRENMKISQPSLIYSRYTPKTGVSLV
ncbi:hypothetical protein [Sulfolobus spindle-shaped virus]|nr:hypothetical protein [Sulfolobus spindle-shaped virus]